MQKKAKIKLKGVERPSRVLEDLQQLQTAIGMAVESMAAVTGKLADLSVYIQSVNPNIHPVKFSTKQQWQDTVDDTVRLINGRLQEILNLECIPNAIKEGLINKPKAA